MEVVEEKVLEGALILPHLQVGTLLAEKIPVEEEIVEVLVDKFYAVN